MIELIKVNKTYSDSARQLEALRDISFLIEKGSFTSIIGPSGCGKTTLLKIISSLLEPTEGTVMVNGAAPHKALKGYAFGFVFQKPTLLPWRTAIGNISLPSEILRDGKYSLTPNQLLDLVGLNGYEDFFPHQLSLGMQARVALVRALSFNPSILLMDEPFSHIDEITREELSCDLLRIWKEIKSTIVFITHSVNEAVFLSDRVIVLTKRPGLVKEIVNIDLPRPREHSPDFIKKAEYIKRSLNNHESKF